MVGRPVQIVLTVDQVELLAGAATYTSMQFDDGPGGSEENAENVAALELLQAFLEQVALHPEAFPVTGRMAQVLTRPQLLVTGPAQRAPGRNKRKKRQAGRRAWQRAQRKIRAEQAVEYNEARERMERELEEAKMQAQQDEARIEQILAQDELTSAELVEMFTLMGVAPLAEKVAELRAAGWVKDAVYAGDPTAAGGIYVPHRSKRDDAADLRQLDEAALAAGITDEDVLAALDEPRLSGKGLLDESVLDTRDDQRFDIEGLLADTGASE